MKKDKIFFGVILALLLVGCNRGDSSSLPPSSEEPVTSTTTSIAPSDSAPTTSQDSEPVPSDSSTPTTSNEYRKGTRKLEFFGLNDFHGAISESSSEPGIFKISSYLKSRYAANEGGTVLLNAGDFWQGSADSNINKGAFLTRAMNELNADAMTIGNHEFDWYDTAIINNKARANYPFLGANIMRKDTNKLATEIVHYDDTFKASTMVEKNDVRIGIVGAIGAYLESSILATAVAPYSFEPVDSYIRSEVINLKSQGADVIALVVHESLAGNYAAYDRILSDKLVDLVFSGHAHAKDNQLINGIPVMQTNGNGKQIMEIEATYDFDLKEFRVDNRTFAEAAYIKGAYSEDVAMRALFSEYEDEINEVKNEVVGTLSAPISKGGLVNMANQLMYKYANDLEYTNVVAVHNTGGVRVEYIPQGPVTYGDIYQAFPFDNEVMIIEEVLGETLKNFISYHSSYPMSSHAIIDDENYTLVTIDYLSVSEYSSVKDMAQKHTGQYVREFIAQNFRDKGTIDGYDY